MNKLIVANLKANIAQIDVPDVVVAAPYPFIYQVKAIRAAQDVSQFPPGAYTGEVTAEMLKKLDVKYCLVGHAERRKYFGETNEIIYKKIIRLLENDIIPIICVGNEGEIPKQVRDDINAYIMFEPASAISTPGQYHPEQVAKVLEFKENVKGKFLYGGSINDQNIDDYMFADGFVIGQASLDPEILMKICQKLSQS